MNQIATNHPIAQAVATSEKLGVNSTGPPQGEFYGEYDDNGVDVSLIRSMLRLSPLERLAQMEQYARDTQTLGEYGRRHREAKTGPDR